MGRKALLCSIFHAMCKICLYLPRTTQVNLYCDVKATKPNIIAYGDDQILLPDIGAEWIYVSRDSIVNFVWQYIILTHCFQINLHE